MSEHSAGSDVVSMKTKATAVDGGWKITGTKMWITNVRPWARSTTRENDHLLRSISEKGPRCQHHNRLCQNGPRSRKQRHHRLHSRQFFARVLVRPQTRQVRHAGIQHGGIGLRRRFRAPREHARSIEQGSAGADGRLGYRTARSERRTTWVRPPKTHLLLCEADHINFRIMSSALSLVLPYTHTRTQFSQPLAHNQLVQAKLADIYTKYRASSAFTHSVASALDKTTDSNGPNTQDCAGAILYAAERATECALDAIQLMGGMGYVNEVPAGRLLRDAKLYEIGAGTSEVRRIVIGRAFNRECAS